MKRRSVLIATVVLVATFIGGPVLCLPVEGSYLAVSARLDNTFFRQACSAVFLALSIYEMDALAGKRKDAIIGLHGSHLVKDDIQLDLEKIDIRKKGWTRYYPVTIAGQPFIVRIFLTKETTYQTQMPIIFEVKMKEPPVTCQILPGIKDILESCKIRPHRISLDLQAARSP